VSSGEARVDRKRSRIGVACFEEFSTCALTWYFSADLLTKVIVKLCVLEQNEGKKESINFHKE
jgi:hypothetical protein